MSKSALSFRYRVGFSGVPYRDRVGNRYPVQREFVAARSRRVAVARRSARASISQFVRSRVRKSTRVRLIRRRVRNRPAAAA